jgi:hypothetical protein
MTRRSSKQSPAGLNLRLAGRDHSSKDRLARSRRGEFHGLGVKCVIPFCSHDFNPSRAQVEDHRTNQNKKPKT